MSTFNNVKEQKFIKVYEVYVVEIYQFIYTRSGFDIPIAEDITQDIFLDVFKGLDGFKGLCSERTWIFRIARNKLNDFYRRQYSPQYDSCELEAGGQLRDPAQDIDAKIEKSFESQLVWECISKLPIHYRLILLMKYVEGKSVRQIAKVSNKSTKATESMLQRAKGAFIKEYQLSKDREER